jgi:hypothetical protein
VVPVNEPFKVVIRETFGMQRTKKYNIYADDVLVNEQYYAASVPIVYQFVVDDPALVSVGKTTIRLKFEFPVDAATGIGDPSMARIRCASTRSMWPGMSRPSSAGRLIALNKGKEIVTVKAGGKTKKYTITVK